MQFALRLTVLMVGASAALAQPVAPASTGGGAGAGITLLEGTNPFDSKRAMWPDRAPPAPPPPAPPPPEAISDQDLQLYGVTIVGNSRMATFKVGKRFAGIATEGRGFATLSQGQRLGEFTVAQVLPDQVVLQAPGGQQVVRFNKKSDRSSTSAAVTAPAPVQAATVAAPGSQEGSGLTEPGSSALGNPKADGAATAIAPAAAAPAPPAATGLVQTNPANNAGATNSVGGGLAEALAAARARAAAQGAATGRPEPIFGNPFNQK
jgi:hypothetical protein